MNLATVPRYRCRRRHAPDEWPAPDEWAGVAPTTLRGWNDEADPLAGERGPSTFRLLWSASALHLRADVPCRAPVVDPHPSLTGKTHGLWELDVVELFVSRDGAALPYGELEASPLGQWLDYFVHAPRGVVDRTWTSGVSVRGSLGAHEFSVEMALPWRGLGGPEPRAGQTRRFNVYVAQGAAPERRFLAYSPTLTPRPDFHVPDRFAELHLE